MLVQDADGVVTAANPTVECILGVTLDQLQGLVAGDPRWGYIDEHGQPVPVEDMPATQALASGSPTPSRVIGVYRPSTDRVGEHVWVDVHAEPLYRSADVPPYAVVSTFSVIAGSRARELQLAQAHRLYRLVVEQSTDVVALVSPVGTVLWVSPAVTRVLGYEPHELIGVNAPDIVHPDDAEAGRIAFRALLTGAPPATTLRRLRHKDGRYVWVEFSARVVNGADGHATRVVTTMRDVSVRTQAEHDRDAAVHRFDVAMRFAPIGMVIASLDGTMLEVNDSFADFLGHPADTLVGQQILNMILEEDRDDASDTVRRVLAGEPPAVNTEQRYQHADGSVVWGRRSLAVVRDEAGAPLYFLGQVVNITERKKVQAEMATLAMTDPLTGLPNRLVLLDRLSHALAIARRDGNRVGVLFLDLDLFKQVNDTFGHEAGDEVLRQVGTRLTSTVREEDTALRLGGDEFILLCESVTHPDEVQQLAERVSVAISAPYDIGDERAQITVSIGIAIGDGPSAEALLAQADASMYRAKQSGRSSVSVYEDAAAADVIDRLTLESELHHAVDNEQLRLHYQPVVALATGAVQGYEALLRWQHPTRGIVPPDRFLPSVEHSRLIVTIGNWVLNRACHDASSWPGSASVAVNISARHLARADFPDTVRESLARSGLDPTRLCLEITESSVLHTSTSTLSSTNALLDLGVSLALDDFGTGQSSIAALHKLRLNAIKIDRSFVADLPGSATAANLVDGLIHLGRGLGLDVIAEGIETPEQAAWLIDHHCPHGQGFFYGRPQPLGVDNAPTSTTRA